MGYVEKKVDQATGAVEKIAGKTIDSIGNVIEKVGDTIEAIASDPKKLAMVGLAVAFPAAATTIGSSLGLSGAAASVVGQTLINTAINGGDIEQAVKSAAITYVGAEAAGQIGEMAKNSGASDAIAKTVGTSASQAITAAAMGKDPVLALVAGGANVASGLITQEIPGFNNLPDAAQNAVRSAVAADMQGKDAIGTAASTLVNSAIGYAKNYAKLQTDLTAKGFAALDTNALASVKNADANDIANVVKAAETAQTYGKVLNAEDVAGITSAENAAAADEYVTQNIINPAKAEQAGFGTDVNAWEEAQAVGINDPKTWDQYETVANTFEDIMGRPPTPDEAKSYMPHTPKLSDSMDALKVYLGKAEAKPEDMQRLDFDGNGKIELSDVLNLQKNYLGKDTSVPPSDYWSENKTLEDLQTSLKEDYSKIKASDAGFGTDINTWKEADSLGLDKKGWDNYQSVSDMYEDVFGKTPTYDEVKQYMPHQVTSNDVTSALKVYLGKAQATPDQ
mgnify:FL=1